MRLINVIRSTLFYFFLIDEKNEMKKEAIRKKLTEYLKRAEQLKEYLSEAEDKRQTKAISANGSEKGSKTKLV